MMDELPWSELVPMFSINPEAASRKHIAKMAADLMDANRRLKEAEEALEKIATHKEGYQDRIKVKLFQDTAAYCLAQIRGGVK